MFMGFIKHFYIIFGTNLLTRVRCQFPFFPLFQCFKEKEYQTEMKQNETFWRSYFWKERNPGDLESMLRKQSHESGARPPPLGVPSTLVGPSWLP